MDSETSSAKTIQTVLRLEGGAILACASRLDSPSNAASVDTALNLLAESLNKGGKIIVTGVGKSGKIAQKMAATFSSTGSLAIYLHPTEGLHGDLGIVQSSDVVLALSYSGNSQEILGLLPSLKEIGVSLIGVGGKPQSPLAQQCNVWIDASVEQEACPNNLAPTSSTTLALALGDALAVALMRRQGFNALTFARNHPGGALGRRLHTTVAQIMHPAKEIATVSADSSMDEVVIATTERKLGAVLVVDAKRFLGIITDGDIRRALSAKERFFQLRARDIMTSKATVVAPEVLASEALRIMEERESQISVLPVVESGEWVGLVRLHDIVRSF